jgi:hypothetical protein
MTVGFSRRTALRGVSYMKTFTLRGYLNVFILRLREHGDAIKIVSCVKSL